MFRQIGLALLAVSVIACGNGGGGTDAAPPDVAVPDAGIDAGGADPIGVWSVTQFATDSAGTLGTTGPDRVNGTLEMTGDGLLGHAIVLTQGDRLGPIMLGGIRPYTRNGTSIEWGSTTFTWSPGPPEALELVELGTSVSWARHSHAESDMLTVQGQISFIGTDPLTPIVTPRVGLVFLLRAAGEPDIIQVPGGDMALSGFGSDLSDVTTFDLSRTEGALGVERITFGTASASIGLVVVYDDVNANGMLDTLWTSCGAGEDCVRGVSELVVGYRIGSSQELTDSPFAFLRSRWTPAAIVPDFRPTTPVLGLISVDRGAETLPFDVVVPADPASVFIPPFQL